MLKRKYPDTELSTAHNLANVTRGQGEYKEARQLYPKPPPHPLSPIVTFVTYLGLPGGTALGA